MKQQEAARKTTTSGRSKFLSLVAYTPSNIVIQAPSMENSVRFMGGAVAALVAMRYAGSLRSACVVGLLSGLFAHSLYADVLRKKRRNRRDKCQVEVDTDEDEKEEEDAVIEKEKQEELRT